MITLCLLPTLPITAMSVLFCLQINVCFYPKTDIFKMQTFLYPISLPKFEQFVSGLLDFQRENRRFNVSIIIMSVFTLSVSGHSKNGYKSNYPKLTVGRY